MRSSELSSAEYYLELSRKAESVLSALDLKELSSGEGLDEVELEVYSPKRGRRRLSQERHPLTEALARLAERSDLVEDSSGLTDYLSKVDLDVSKLADDSEGTL